ncbi:MAG: alpha/beta fold hydrolase [Chloroflexota bacterium]
MGKSSPLTALTKSAASLLAGAMGSWIAYSALAIDHNLMLTPAIDAERERFAGTTTRLLSTYVSRHPRQPEMPAFAPLVLIHSINAAASAYEMGPIFQIYRGTRDVYALDLPGFGFSERANREYTPKVYQQAIIDLLERVGEKADVIALSLGCEFAASAALERPELFRSLTLLSPSGFTQRDKKRVSQAAQQSGKSDFFYKLFSFPLWGQAFYDLIATRKSIHYFLQQSFEGAVDPGLEAYAYLTSHQPGAQHAPLYFVSGKLFSPEIREEVYHKLTLPVLVLYDIDSFVRFDTLPDLVDQRSNWHAKRIVPTKALPQFEKMSEVAQQLDRFWTDNALEATH